MSCSCRKNNGRFFTHADNGCCNKTQCCEKAQCCENFFEDDCCDNACNQDVEDLTGVSCPFNNNNDCACADSLREAACRLTNQRVIIHVDGCKMCVVIVGIGDCFLKTVNPCTQKIVYFNLNRIDNIEDVLPRCY